VHFGRRSAAFWGVRCSGVWFSSRRGSPQGRYGQQGVRMNFSRARVLFAILVGSVALCLTRSALAFPYIVQSGDTLASLSERFYGKIQNERLLVIANSLDSNGGIRIIPGMLVEIPAVTYVRLQRGQSWKELAISLLGHEERAFALASANGSKPWLLPEEESEAVVPYNLRVVATGNETIVALAYRYLGNREAAWMLDNYNQRKGRPLVRGEVVLIPLVELQLTAEGKQLAANAQVRLSLEAGGAARTAQMAAEIALPQLQTAVTQAQYVEAVRLGTGLLQSGALARRQRGRINRLLLEAYAALGVTGHATEACVEWLKAEPHARLNPVLMSPKLLAACALSTPPSEPRGN
jgi:hypothetical protein